MLPALEVGQPPSMEWMTWKSESLVGSKSFVSETWHEPPPWVAPPMKDSVCFAPMGIVAVDLAAAYTPGRCLHGKSDPSATRGELVNESAPYGAGVANFMWP